MDIILNKISKKLINYITTEDIIGDFVYKQKYFYTYSYRFMGIKKINGVEFIKLDNVEFGDLHYYYIPMFEVEDKCLNKLIKIVKNK